MNGKNRSTHSLKSQRGMVYTEYAVSTLMVVLVLFLPVAENGNLSLFDLVMQGIRNFGMNSSFLLSLP